MRVLEKHCQCHEMSRAFSASADLKEARGLQALQPATAPSDANAPAPSQVAWPPCPPLLCVVATSSLFTAVYKQ